MVNVIASVRIKEGTLSNFLEILRANLPAVRKEQGCIEYTPAVDVDSGLERQHMDARVVTIVEKWESLEALHAHLATSHMVQFQEEVAAFVENVTLTVLQDA